MDEPSPCSSMTSKSCQARDILSIKSFAQSTASATVALTGRSYFAAAYPASHNSPTTTLAGHDWRRRCEKSLSQTPPPSSWREAFCAAALMATLPAAWQSPSRRGWCRKRREGRGNLRLQLQRSVLKVHARRNRPLPLRLAGKKTSGYMPSSFRAGIKAAKYPSASTLGLISPS